MARPEIHPTLIDLNELPVAGAQYSYSKASGELDEALKPLIGDRPYEVKIELKPEGNAFSIKGEVSTQMPLVCSRCAEDLEAPLEFKFEELLLIESPRPRTGKSAGSGRWQNDGPFCNHLSSAQFRVGEFIHEQAASNEPFRPIKGPDCESGSCPSYQKAKEKGWISEDGTNASPFSVLAELKPTT